MKKFILILIIGVCGCLNTFPQATSLTVDNQSPGWLSSKIGFGDQQTVRELKVSGYLNGTDINFLLGLQSDYSLRELDLSDVHIIKGGEEILIGYYSTSTGAYKEQYASIKENDYFYYWLFWRFNKLDKMITPKALSPGTEAVRVGAKEVVFQGQFKRISINTHSSSSNSGDKSFNYRNYSVELPEGLDSVYIQDIDRGVLKLPSSLTKIAGRLVRSNIISAIEHPENLKSYNMSISGDTIFIPEGTTANYKKSIFKNMKYFVEMNSPHNFVFAQPKLKLYKDDTDVLSYSTEPEKVYYKEIIWENDNENCIALSQDGSITALEPGIANVTISSAQNTDVKATCTVSVFEHTTGVTISEVDTTLNIGSTLTLAAQTLPLSTSDGEITWSSSDESVATVDENGNVTCLKIGECIIKATTVDGGYEAECHVSVAQPASTATIDKEDISLLVGKSEKLTVTIKPDETTDKTVTWSSSNDSIAVVDANGMVTAKKAGSAIISATANSNKEVTATCEVTVLQPVTGITITEPIVTLMQLGEMKQMTVNVLPEDASNKAVRWTSYNGAVCAVSENGTLIATGYGTATVIATTVDGGFPAVCIVTVTNEPTYKAGDVNHDGSITMADANAVVNYFLATEKPEDFDVESADVNGDGDITMADANQIVNMFLGGGK